MSVVQCHSAQNTTRRSIIFTSLDLPARSASNVTCRRAPTWSLISAATTAFAFHDPTCREVRHSQRVQRVSHRQVCSMGLGRDWQLVWTCAGWVFSSSPRCYGQGPRVRRAHSNHLCRWPRTARSPRLPAPPHCRCSPPMLRRRPKPPSFERRTDHSALVRRAVPHSLSNSDPNSEFDRPGAPTDDQVRAVRIEAADVLASPSAAALPSDVGAAFDRATKEYLAAQD